MYIRYLSIALIQSFNFFGKFEIKIETNYNLKPHYSLLEIYLLAINFSYIFEQQRIF